MGTCDSEMTGVEVPVALLLADAVIVCIAAVLAMVVSETVSCKSMFKQKSLGLFQFYVSRIKQKSYP